LTKVQHLTISKIPPSVNNLFATIRRRRVKTAEYKEWIAVSTPLIKSGLKPVETYPVEVTIWVLGGDGWNNRRDIANCEKPVTDLLVACGILVDDATKYVWDTCQRYRPTPSDGEHGPACIHIRIAEGIGEDWPSPRGVQ